MRTCWTVSVCSLFHSSAAYNTNSYFFIEGDLGNVTVSSSFNTHLMEKTPFRKHQAFQEHARLHVYNGWCLLRRKGSFLFIVQMCVCSLGSKEVFAISYSWINNAVSGRKKKLKKITSISRFFFDVLFSFFDLFSLPVKLSIPWGCLSCPQSVTVGSYLPQAQIHT